MFYPTQIQHVALYLKRPIFVSLFQDPRTCSICFQVFNGNLLLYRHRQRDHELGGFTCTECAPVHTHHQTRYDLKLHQKVRIGVCAMLVKVFHNLYP